MLSFRHPDKSDDPEATEKFTKIAEAYEVTISHCKIMEYCLQLGWCSIHFSVHITTVCLKTILMLLCIEIKILTSCTGFNLHLLTFFHK